MNAYFPHVSHRAQKGDRVEFVNARTNKPETGKVQRVTVDIAYDGHYTVEYTILLDRLSVKGKRLRVTCYDAQLRAIVD